MEEALALTVSLKDIDAEFVNPFLSALHSTLSSLGNQLAMKGALSLTEMEALSRDISIVIIIEGGLNGAVIMGMDLATTLRIASSFLMGIPVDAIDDMVKSSLDEFSIRVCEKARIQLINKGYLANVNYHISYGEPVTMLSRTPFLSIPFQTQHGQIDVFINLTKHH